MIHRGVKTDGNVFDIFFRQMEIGLAFFRHFLVYIWSFFTLFLFYLLFGRMCISYCLANQVIQSFDNIIAHPLQAVRRGHAERNPRHYILTVFALRIHERSGIDNLHGLQVAQISGTCCGTYVDRDAVRGLNTSGSYPYNFLIFPDTDRHQPFLLAQHHRQLAQGKDVDG